MANRRYFTFGVLLVASALGACDEAAFQVRQRLNSGSLVAVEACVKRNKSDLVEVDVIRARCVDQHESRIYEDVLNGGGGRGYLNEFKATVTNTSRSYIITRLTITVMLPGEPTNIQAEEFRSLWIVPKESFSLYANDIELSAEDYSAMTESRDDPYGWSISGVYGIELDVN